MRGVFGINLGLPALLEFRGPDSVRYLNGQVTQDVRRVTDGLISLPSCVTDAKGRLQFRVMISAMDGALVVEGPAEAGEVLEARLTRYLIADDVEVLDRTGCWRLWHFTGDPGEAPAGVLVRVCRRLASEGVDWWIPNGLACTIPEGVSWLEGDALEAMRILGGIPRWGAELTEGMLPPEAGLDQTDVSYQKGCYIGQEVISRIKSAGKLNRRLVRFTMDAAVPLEGLELVGVDGAPAGTVTSVSPLTDGAARHALGYVKRGAADLRLRSPDGTLHDLKID